MFKRLFSLRNKSISAKPPSSIPINATGNITIAAQHAASSYNIKSLSGVVGVTGVAASANPYTYTIPGQYTIGSNMANATSVVTFYNVNNNEIVRLNKDGTITWGNGINVDEAADAFSRSISIGAEMQSGITEGTKRRMRDSVFADLIEIAKEKGSLTADDLTYLLEASKIVEKLKGGKE